MKALTSLIIGLFVSWCGSVVANEDPLPPQKPLLWKVTSADGVEKGYVFGTIHLGDPRVAKIPPVVSDALKSCDVLATEILLDKETMAKSGEAAMLPADEKRNLGDLLPAETKAKLDAELKRIVPYLSVDIPPFNRMQVWAVTITLPMLEEMMEYSGAAGVDKRLVTIAEKAEIELDALETVEEQLGALSNYEPDEAIELLDLTLEGMEKSREVHGTGPTEQMILAYRKGVLADLAKAAEWDEELFGRPEPGISKRFMKSLLDDRNVRMVDRTLERYKKRADKKFFIAVGAMHLVGETGLVDAIQRAGYSVERVVSEPAAAKAEPLVPAEAGN